MSNKSIILFTALLLASFTCSADFQLTKNGKSQWNGDECSPVENIEKFPKFLLTFLKKCV